MPSPSRPPLPTARRDALALVLLLSLLLAMAWQAERARVSHAADGARSLATCSLLPATSDAERDQRDACVEQAVTAQLAGREPLAASLEAINEHARRDESFSRRCHMLLHEHGRRHDGEVLPGTIEHDGKDCAAGFLHGWMMEHLVELDRTTVAAWCDASRTTLERADCEHGMGHVLVRHLDGDLPAALQRCRALGDRTFLRNCASGAFMENRFGGQARDGAAPTRFWQAGEPWRPCRTGTSRDLLDACAAWAVRDVEDAKRLAWCTTLDPSIDSRACRIAAGGIANVDRSASATCGRDPDCWYGRGFAWAMLGWDQLGAESAARRCLAGPGTLRDACARGVGFRRSASLPDPLARAARIACDDEFSGAARAACHAGAAERGAPIAYA